MSQKLPWPEGPCRHDEDDFLERVGAYIIVCLRCMAEFDLRDVKTGWKIKKEKKR